MSKVKIGFSNLQVPQQIERSRLITTRMTGNANFATPVPDLASVISATNEVETAYNESRGRDKNKVQIMRLRKAEMLALIVQLAAYVQSITDGDEEKILSSGFDVVRRGEPQPPVGKVMNVRVSNGPLSGSIKVLWNRTPGARVYIVQITTDPIVPGGFSEHTITSKTRTVMLDFNPATKYWLRVAAIGRDGRGNWSDPVAKIVE